MNITVNGQEKTLHDNTTVQMLLNDLKIEEKTMAVAINMQVVKKENWDNHVVVQDDKIECLHFVGGG